MNKTLLQIKSSLFSDAGVSTTLANEFVDKWYARNPGAAVLVRDLSSDPVPHLTAERFQAFVTKPEARNVAQQAHVAHSDALIEELKRADVVVLGVPMYNFGLPSTLKAYFDHIARAGVTFNYTAQGPVGLLGAKKVVIFAARGGHYLGQPADTQSSYLRNFLGFLGIKDVEFVYAEGLAISAESKQGALAQARNEIVQLAQAETRTSERLPLAA